MHFPSQFLNVISYLMSQKIFCNNSHGIQYVSHYYRFLIILTSASAVAQLKPNSLRDTKNTVNGWKCHEHMPTFTHMQTMTVKLNRELGSQTTGRMMIAENATGTISILKKAYNDSCVITRSLQDTITSCPSALQPKKPIRAVQRVVQQLCLLFFPHFLRAEWMSVGYDGSEGNVCH